VIGVLRVSAVNKEKIHHGDTEDTEKTQRKEKYLRRLNGNCTCKRFD
jgi:hypothetical protein